MKQALAFGLIVAMLAATVVVGADEDAAKGDKGKGRRGGGERGIAAILKQLDLNEEQQAKVKEAHGELQEAMKAARENKDREAARAAFGKFRESVMSVLTDEQKEKFQKLVSERRGDGKGRGKGKGKGKGERPEKGEDN